MRILSSRWLRGGIGSAAVISAALLAIPPAAEARSRWLPPSPREVHRKVHQTVRDHFVPRRLVVQHRTEYRSYYGGRTWYGPHHHYHESYNFPVYVGSRVVRQPYAYCGDEVFLSGRLTLPRLAIGVVVEPRPVYRRVPPPRPVYDDCGRGGCYDHGYGRHDGRVRFEDRRCDDDCRYDDCDDDHGCGDYDPYDHD